MTQVKVKELIEHLKHFHPDAIVKLEVLTSEKTQMTIGDSVVMREYTYDQFDLVDIPTTVPLRWGIDGPIVGIGKVTMTEEGMKVDARITDPDTQAYFDGLNRNNMVSLSLYSPDGKGFTDATVIPNGVIEDAGSHT